MSAALAAGVLSSCSKNEMVELLPQTENPNAIGLTTGTVVSKSTETTTGGLNTEGTELTFYSDNADFGTSGSLKFTHRSGKWEAEGNPTWAGIDFTSGLRLFSIFDGANVVVTPATGAASAYTVATDVADQKDLVFFATELHAIPTGGNITAIYNHALARVKMQDVTTGMDVDCKAVSLKGFDGTAVPTITAAGNAIAWTDNNDESEASYVYDLANADVKSNDMYIIPQKTALNEKKQPAAEGVEVLCMTKIGSTQRAGWESVEAYLKANLNVTSVKLAGADYTGVMYVKAVFPIDAVEFVNNQYYNLQLNFAGSSLQYTDNKYFDENGAELVVDGTPTTPDPEVDDTVNPDANDTIGLFVQVAEWPSVADQDLN